MSDHKFRIGEVVQLLPTISNNVPRGLYKVTMRLPESAGEYGYRVKSINEPHERFARESELNRT
jgi:hypothetical protein